jgi:hypothetical protein
MRKLVIILIAFIAVVTFIRAFDSPRGSFGSISEELNVNISPGVPE